MHVSDGNDLPPDTIRTEETAMTDSDELIARRHDVDELVSILSKEGRDAAPEDALRAWSLHSERSAASWLLFDAQEPHEIVAAYDSLMLDGLERAVRDALPEHRQDEAADFVADHLAQTSTDPEDPDLLAVSASDGSRRLGTMRRWSVNDQSLVEAVYQRFDVELPSWHALHPRRLMLAPFGIRVTDAEGSDA